MTSRELIAAEANNTDRIALYREGLFWKAYERSAFALCTQVRAFKPTRKVLKALAGGDIVSVGFPAIAADRILAGLRRVDVSAAGAADADASVSFISDASAVADAGSVASPAAGATDSAASSAARASGVAGAVSVGTEACAAGEVANASGGSCAAPQGDAAGVGATTMVFFAPQAIDDDAFRAWKSALPISLSIPRPAAAVDTSSCDETSAAAAELSFRDASVGAVLHGRSADAMRPAVGSADFAVADRAGSADFAAAAAGADFAARPAQPRLWSRLGGWLVRWASGSDASSRAGVGFADTSRTDAETAVAASASDILDALRNFEVADKTPMECMMFIAELKKQLLKI